MTEYGHFDMNAAEVNDAIRRWATEAGFYPKIPSVFMLSFSEDGGCSILSVPLGEAAKQVSGPTTSISCCQKCLSLHMTGIRHECGK